jgi:hypothetical protein
MTTEITFYGLTYNDGKEDHVINLHAPTVEQARDFAEMNELFAKMTFVSSEVLPDLVHKPRID